MSIRKESVHSRSLCILAAVLLFAAVARAQIVNYQEVNGVKFATLDDAAVAGATGGQPDYLNLPSGWTIAPSGSLSQLAAFGNTWSTDCLVLADGTMVATSTGVDCTKHIVSTDNAIRPIQKRILISQTSGTISSVNPTSSPLGGGIQITISGTNLGTNADVTFVSLAGIAATIVSQTDSEVVVTAGLSTTPVTGNIVVQSASRGAMTFVNGFTYAASGNIQSVIPSNGPIAGGNVVTITSSSAFGSGSDITAVTLGSAVCTIQSQTASSVVVTVTTGTAGVHTVTVVSASVGSTSLINGYTFNPLPQIVSVTPMNGPLAGNTAVTLTGDFGTNSDVTSVTLAGVVATIRSQTPSQIVVTTAPSANGVTGDVVIVSTSRGIAKFASFTYTGAGVIATVAPTAGSLNGKNEVTISGTGLGSGSDISSVTFGGVQADIVSQTANSVVVTAPAGTTAGIVDIAVSSPSVGVTSKTASYTYLAVGVVKGVSPNSGPTTGGTAVTISGTDLGSGTDITDVSLAGISATIISQTAEQVLVQTNVGQPMLGNVVVKSVTRGTSQLTSAFTYLTAGTIRTIQPASVPVTGGQTVTIDGEDLGNGSDIVSVTLNNVAATIVSQTATQVVVTPGAGAIGTGSVVVVSTSRGQTTFPNAFSFVADGSNSLATPSSGPVAGGTSVVLTSSDPTTPLGSGVDVTRVTVNGVDATLVSQSATRIEILTRAGTAGVGSIIVFSDSLGQVVIHNQWTYLAAGAIAGVAPTHGAISGGDTVTISGTDLGSGSDITAVTIHGVPATIISQTSSQVVVSTGASVAGAADVVVSSASRGDTTIANAFTYDPALTPVRFITVNGINYGVLDRAAPADPAVSGCQDTLMALPEGWTLAPNCEESRVAILGRAYTFGTTCLILDDGTGVDSVTGASCGSNLLISISGKYSVSTCPGRIVISQAAVNQTNTFETSGYVTNYYVSQGIAFATIENYSPHASDVSCGGHASRLPAGWSLAADNANTQSVIQGRNFGTTCLVLAGGKSYNHFGVSCGDDQLLSYNDHFTVATCPSRILIQSAVPVPLPPAVDRQVQMKWLILSNTGDHATEGQFNVARRTAMMVGMPFDVYCVTPAAGCTCHTGDVAPLLTTAINKGSYSGILVAGNYFFSGDLANKVKDYARLFHVNIVVLYTFPSTDLGVTVSTTYPGGATPFRLKVHDSWASDASMAGLTTNHRIPVSGTYRYPAVITDATKATPILDFLSPDTNVVEGVAGIIFDAHDGHKEMHFFYDQAAWDLPAAVYGHMIVNWISHGTYLGARRIHLAPQIDDLYLTTGVWQPAKKKSDGPEFRISADDMQQLHDFFTGLNTQLPAGSHLTAEWGINGQGVNKVHANDALFQKSLELMQEFWWESHGYTHLNFTQNGKPPHDTTYAETWKEVADNYNFMLPYMFNTPSRFARFSNKSMISPGIYGMQNGNSLRALYEFGIKYLVGENSRLDLTPEHPYHSIHTNSTFHGFDGEIILPRWSSKIYFDCSNIEQNIAEYNFYYNSYWGRDRTWEEIMGDEAKTTAINLLTLRHDPYMFHQANVRSWYYVDPVDGVSKKFSLLSLWVRYVTQKTMEFSTLPILNWKQDEMAERILAREARDSCGGAVFINIGSDNVARSLTVQGGSTVCKLPITGVHLTSSDAEMEYYGPDQTAWVTIAPGETENFTLDNPFNC